MTKRPAWSGIRRELEGRRAALNAEIGAYPPPITACDAQFNRLLEQRRELSQELGRLEAAIAGDVPIGEYIKACRCRGGAGGEEQK